MSEQESAASGPQARPAEPVAAVVLGAGLGTRMRSKRPKVLHEVAGRAMLGHVLGALEALSPVRTAVVAAPDTVEAVRAATAYAPVAADVVVQHERLGTADAVKAARGALDGVTTGTILVLFGDTPFIRAETLAAMTAKREAGAGVVVLGFRAADPSGYGRLIRDPDGTLARIVEERDADAAARAVDLCNAGVMAIDAGRLFALLDRIDNDNAKGEYYLTDAPALARADGLAVAVVEAPEDEVLGIDSKAELADAEARWQAARRRRAMTEEGAILRDPASVWFSYDTVLSQDADIGQNVVFGPGVVVEEGARIKPFCHLEGCRIGAGAEVGPYARLRPGAAIGESARIGNFVEVKNAVFAAGAKANHLSYVGDAEVGAGANIGAGTITCNYDGHLKHRTDIGAGAFIGSNTALVAPVAIGPGAIVGAGSTITEDVPADALGVARGRQHTVAEGGKRFHAQRRRRKTERDAARAEGEGDG